MVININPINTQLNESALSYGLHTANRPSADLIDIPVPASEVKLDFEKKEKDPIIKPVARKLTKKGGASTNREKVNKTTIHRQLPGYPFTTESMLDTIDKIETARPSNTSNKAEEKVSSNNQSQKLLKTIDDMIMVDE